MRKKIFVSISLFMILAMSCVSCGSSYGKASYNSAESTAAYAEAKGDYSMEYAAEEPAAANEAYWEEDTEETMEEPQEAGAGTSAYTAEQDNTGAAVTLSNDKLVYTCTMEIQTTEYKKTVQAIREKIRQYGAIIESESEYDNDRNWYYSGHVKNTGTMILTMTIRVPVAKYDAFVTDAGDFGKVTSKSQNVENISRRYHSTEARIEALTKEEKRLNEMMDRADTIEEMIYIEERLTDVEAELNANRTNLAGMDVDVAYSTVNLDVREVLIYTEPEKPTITFGQRVARAFEESWSGFCDFMEGLLIVIIHLLPFMICALIIVVIIIILNRIADKKHPERKERRERLKAFKKEEKALKKARKRGIRPAPSYVPAKQPEVPKEAETKDTEAEQEAAETAESTQQPENPQK